MNTEEVKAGDKVYYTAPHGLKENGIVKSLNESKTTAWVVYHCNDEWHRYYDYTGAATNIKDLTLGWHNQFNWGGDADTANKIFGDRYGIDWSFGEN